MPTSDDVSFTLQDGAPDDHHKTSPVRTVALVSLGCPKNLVDSEKMLGLLAESGFVPTADESTADAIVVNTCGFLDASQQESLDEIERAAEHKATGTCKRLVVAGCMVQRQRAKLFDSCPEIDAMIGVFDRDRIVEAVTGEVDQKRNRDDLDVERPVYSSIAPNAVIASRRRGIDTPGYYEDDTTRLRLTPRHYAYLRISEGCNQNCTFCTIPSIRGKLRSKPIARIQAELGELISDGAFEINLIGQDTTSYGGDIGFGPGLAGMLQAVDQTVAQATGGVGGWIRLMYAYPSCFTDEMIDTIAQLPNVVKYIDMPLQHINDRILTSMRRGTSRQLIEILLKKLRRRVPGIAIRTTLITGFPGETDAEHEELLQFVKDFGFDAMGVFAYSPEPGTPAGTQHANGQAIPAELVEERYQQLMLAQQEVVFAKNELKAQRGEKVRVLVEGLANTSDDDAQDTSRHTNDGAEMSYVGRASFQAPQIDGIVIIQSPHTLTTGELVPCQIMGYDGYDLVAQPIASISGVPLPILDTHAAIAEP